MTRARPAAAAAAAAAVVVVLLMAVMPARAALPDPKWPVRDAPITLRVVKLAGFELDSPKELQWDHLHSDGAALSPPANAVTLGVSVYRSGEGYSGDEGAASIMSDHPAITALRYTVQGVPVSAWLTTGAPWSFTLAWDAAPLAALKDGVHDVSVEVKGADRPYYKPYPAFLHLKRGQAGSQLVPVMVGDTPTSMGAWVPTAARVDRREREDSTAFAGYPANATLTRWGPATVFDADLFVEALTPGGALFEEQQMWWADCPSECSLTFIRGLQPYQGEDPRGIDQARLPMQDGPRGVGWMSSYVQGRVAPSGRLVFAELAGRVAWLKPDGAIVTLAGRVTAPGSAPAWIRKPLDVVRSRQVLRGRGDAFVAAGGFGRPMEVAFDDDSPNTLYVTDFTLNVVWKLVVDEGTVVDATFNTPDVAVTLLCGDPGFSAGYADGAAGAARFDAPFGVAFAREAGGEAVLYVADSANHAIRRVRLSDGSVTTVARGVNIEARAAALGDDVRFDQGYLRSAAAGFKVVVTPAQAAAGAKPDIFWPSSLRVDSKQRVVFMEHGFGAIRRMNVTSGAVELLTAVDQKFGEYDHGWAMLDVDRTGAIGPKDAVYWCAAVMETLVDPATPSEPSRFNEVFAYVAPTGGGSRMIFTGPHGGGSPTGWGLRNFTTVPHYPWLVAVSPQGGLLMAGMGVHGVSRLRLRDAAGDPLLYGDDDMWLYFQGRDLFYGRGDGYARAGSLAFRLGHEGHNILRLGYDAWAAQGYTDTQLAQLYGFDAETGDTRSLLLAYVRPLVGPKRDRVAPRALPAGAPAAPTNLALAVGHVAATSMRLSWTPTPPSATARATGDYQLQLIKCQANNTTACAFTATYKVSAGTWNVATGNAEVVILEGLTRATGVNANLRYKARLRARDVAGKYGPWSAATALFKLP